MRFPPIIHRVLSLAMLALLWLVPTGQAQTPNFITGNSGFTSIYRGPGFSTSQNFIVSIPANTSSLNISVENLGTSTGAYTIQFIGMGNEAVGFSSAPSIFCTHQVSGATPPTNTQVGNSFPAANAPAGQADTYSCPVQGYIKLGLSLSFTANNIGLFEVGMFTNYSGPQPANAVTSATSLSNQPNQFATITEKGPRWEVLSTPAVSVQATASRAAGATGVRHVADCVSYSAGAIAAPAATQLTLNLRDGATGAGTIIWSKTLTIPATAAPHYDFNFCGLNLIGSTATAMTLEFSALLTNEFESVTLTGYDVQ